MKLVLTSGGVSNKSIETELRNILGKDFKDLKMLFCITASNYEGGDMNDWLIDDFGSQRSQIFGTGKLVRGQTVPSHIG